MWSFDGYFNESEAFRGLKELRIGGRRGFMGSMDKLGAHDPGVTETIGSRMGTHVPGRDTSNRREHEER